MRTEQQKRHERARRLVREWMMTPYIEPHGMPSAEDLAEHGEIFREIRAKHYERAMGLILSNALRRG